MPVFRQVEDWYGEEVEMVRQVHRGETITRVAADHAVCMQTVVSVIGRLEVADYLKGGLIQKWDVANYGRAERVSPKAL